MFDSLSVLSHMVEPDNYNSIIRFFKNLGQYIDLIIYDAIGASLRDARSAGVFPIGSDVSCADERIKEGISGSIDSPEELDGAGNRFDPPAGAILTINTIDNMKTDRRFDEKVLLFSHSLPPSPSGQATVLYRLLDGISPNSYCLASAKNYDDASFLQTTTQRLPVRYRWVGRALQIRSFVHPTVNRASLLLNTMSKIAHDTWRLQKIVREERCRSIIVCTGDACDLPVAYMTSLVTRAPIFLYYFDYFSEQWAGTPYHGFAKAVESFIVKRAKGIIVPNEKMRDELAGRYGVDSTLIHNPIMIDPPVSERLHDWPNRPGEIRIVYTGSIYRAQSDALKTLLQVVDELSHLNVTLHLYTAQTREELEKQAIHGSYVLHPHAAYSIIRDVQKKADILYLPLSFDPEISKVIDTSSPGKMGEYLASGRPVLVHAPPPHTPVCILRETDVELLSIRMSPRPLNAKS